MTVTKERLLLVLRFKDCSDNKLAGDACDALLAVNTLLRLYQRQGSSACMKGGKARGNT